MDGTNTYMPVMPAGYGGGFGDMGANGWWIILLFMFMESAETLAVSAVTTLPVSSMLMYSAVSIRALSWAE